MSYKIVGIEEITLEDISSELNASKKDVFTALFRNHKSLWTDSRGNAVTSKVWFNQNKTVIKQWIKEIKKKEEE